MTGGTHFAAGVLLAVVTQGGAIGGTIGVGVGSLLLDIDSPTSTLGRVIPIVPRLIKHRTWTHTVYFVAILALLWPPLGIGALSHLILDAITKEGISPLWPCKLKIKLPVAITTGGLANWLIGGCCWFATAILFWLKIRGG